MSHILCRCPRAPVLRSRRLILVHAALISVLQSKAHKDSGNIQSEVDEVIPMRQHSGMRISRMLHSVRLSPGSPRRISVCRAKRRVRARQQTSKCETHLERVRQLGVGLLRVLHVRLRGSAKQIRARCGCADPWARPHLCSGDLLDGVPGRGTVLSARGTSARSITQAVDSYPLDPPGRVRSHEATRTSLAHHYAIDSLTSLQFSASFIALASCSSISLGVERTATGRATGVALTERWTVLRETQGVLLSAIIFSMCLRRTWPVPKFSSSEAHTAMNRQLGACNDYENPSLLHINKRRTHTLLQSHATFSYAANQFLGIGSERIGLYEGGVKALSGCDWAFRVYPNPKVVPAAFVSPDYDVSGWARVSCHIAHAYRQPSSALSLRIFPPWSMLRSLCRPAGSV